MDRDKNGASHGMQHDERGSRYSEHMGQPWETTRDLSPQRVSRSHIRQHGMPPVDTAPRAPLLCAIHTLPAQAVM